MYRSHWWRSKYDSSDKDLGASHAASDCGRGSRKEPNLRGFGAAFHSIDQNGSHRSKVISSGRTLVTSYRLDWREPERS
jgi:hypothetical protein